MGVSTEAFVAELTEFQHVSSHIYCRCKKLNNLINATGLCNEVYEDPVALSLRLSKAMDNVHIAAYKGNHSLYLKLFHVAKIINAGLEDYEWISKVDQNLLWLVKGLIGGPESLEAYLHNITGTLALMSDNRSDGKNQSLPSKRVQKLCHTLDRANLEVGLTQGRIKKAIDTSLRSGVRDLTMLVSRAFEAVAVNCPIEPTRGYVLRELKEKGHRLRYDYSALFHGSTSSYDAHHEIFNVWEMSLVPISYVIPLFAILSNGEVVFRSFDNHFYKIAGTRWIGWNYREWWRPAPEVSAIDDQVTWRRFFPCDGYKRNISFEASLLGFWLKLADENSEEHARKVDILKSYMWDLQRQGINHIGNPRKFAAQLSDLSMRNPMSSQENKLLTGFAGAIKKAIVAKDSLLSNLISSNFASWVVANVSQKNLNLTGRGDLTVWGILRSEGKPWRLKLSVRRSAGSCFEGEKCDVAVTLNIPSMLHHKTIRSMEHLAKNIDDLPSCDKRQIFKLGMFFIKKLLQTNLILRGPVNKGSTNIAPHIFSTSRAMEIDPLPKLCDVVKKREERWNSKDLDTIPSSVFLSWGQELASW